MNGTCRSLPRTSGGVREGLTRPISAEPARRCTAMEDVAPAEFRDTIAFFVKYAAKTPARTAQEPGFADQANNLTVAADSCHIDLAHP